jgi:GrpB-like predicted nucleotidyltransferase (UPF0157 family)
MSKVEVVQYNPQWKEKFSLESIKLEKDFKDNFVSIHHIGSTAIEGLSAKPIIDIIVVVKNIFKVNNQMIDGYESRGELGIPFRRYFSSGDFHLHVFEEHNPEIEQHILFRNYLRNNFEVKKDYERVKLELAQKHPAERMQYCLGKNSLINKIIKMSGFKGICLRYVFHKLEQDYYVKKLGDKGFYRFILYEGAEIVGAASVSQDLIIDEIFSENHVDCIKKLLRKWISQDNNSARSQMYFT